MVGVEAIIMELHTMVTMVAMEEVGIMVEVMVGGVVMLLPKD